jgi:hypothetical protein
MKRDFEKHEWVIFCLFFIDDINDEAKKNTLEKD